jgi:hypothetical protein
MRAARPSVSRTSARPRPAARTDAAAPRAGWAAEALEPPQRPAAAAAAADPAAAASARHRAATGVAAMGASWMGAAEPPAAALQARGKPFQPRPWKRPVPVLPAGPKAPGLRRAPTRATALSHQTRLLRRQSRVRLCSPDLPFARPQAPALCLRSPAQVPASKARLRSYAELAQLRQRQIQLTWSPPQPPRKQPPRQPIRQA